MTSKRENESSGDAVNASTAPDSVEMNPVPSYPLDLTSVLAPVKKIVAS